MHVLIVVSMTLRVLYCVQQPKNGFAMGEEAHLEVILSII
jgi:hypothetical protein